MEKIKDINIARVADVVDALIEKKTEIISATEETLALTNEDSGKTIVLARAAGIAITLPAFPEIGVNFKFVVKTGATTGSYIITASELTDNYILFKGGVSLVDSDSGDTHTYPIGDGNDNSIELNGTTQGGLIGSWLKAEYLAEGCWFLSGAVRGSGTVATPLEVNYTTTVAPTTTS